MSKEPVVIPVEGGKLVVYADHAGGWRWHSTAHNGRIVADSGQSYRTRWGAKRAAKRFAGGTRT